MNKFMRAPVRKGTKRITSLKGELLKQKEKRKLTRSEQAIVKYRKGLEESDLLGDQLRRWVLDQMEAMGVSQVMVASATGVSQPNVVHFFKGKQGSRFEVADRYAAAFGYRIELKFVPLEEGKELKS